VSTAPRDFSPINVGKVLPPTTHAVASLLEPAVLTMPTPALLAEVNAGLALRVCRRETTARDVLLVQAMAARLVTASAQHAQATNREPLDGALWLDLGGVADVMARKAPPAIADFLREVA
jgi:hypothetical protein